MNVSNLSNLFRQNSVFQQNQALGQKLRQPAANDALQQLSENLLSARSQEKDLKSRFDIVELTERDQKADSPLAEMPSELLNLYLNQYKAAGYVSAQSEASLMEFRDRLTAFDQTIQGYQDILDGKAELNKMMTMEDVSNLLERTRAAREAFLQKGMENLNRAGEDGLSVSDRAYRLVADEGDQSDFSWKIDASAKDIYAEIDRARDAAHQATSFYRKGASRIVAELNRRGEANRPYHQLDFAAEDTAARERVRSDFDFLYSRDIEGLLRYGLEKDE
ncbi:MAG: hypothetical protein HDT14_02145 [Oscillibacter sp.]|nr:hypothetical protein [Oscillibacter sp.]